MDSLETEIEKQSSTGTYLNALGFEDEFGHRGQDVGLIKHGVSDTLQERLHGCHTVHEKTSAQVTVVKQQKDESRTHLGYARKESHGIKVC